MHDKKKKMYSFSSPISVDKFSSSFLKLTIELQKKDWTMEIYLQNLCNFAPTLHKLLQMNKPFLC